MEEKNRKTTISFLVPTETKAALEWHVKNTHLNFAGWFKSAVVARLQKLNVIDESGEFLGDWSDTPNNKGRTFRKNKNGQLEPLAIGIKLPQESYILAALDAYTAKTYLENHNRGNLLRKWLIEEMEAKGIFTKPSQPENKFGRVRRRKLDVAT